MPTRDFPSNRFFFLVVGDAVALLIVTFWGFAHHGSGFDGLRWLSTFVPLLASWAALSPWFGVYTPHIYANPRQIWRASLAMAFGGPMAAWLRALWLGQAVTPTFVPVIAAFSALGITIWRLLWVIAVRWKKAYG
ncbi:MAG: DUF3054 domain-containing protein [Anaerolineae bacterium]|nr:DUF3054 domain-containing protein [Anaerolineae bacterium]